MELLWGWWVVSVVVGADREGSRTRKEDGEPCGEDENHAREDDGGKVW
jgi:hypothetical protein